MSQAIRVVPTSDLAACREIRREVFIQEQGVDESLDFDDDDATAQHFLALDAYDRALGTARLRTVDGHAKIERVAVLASCRRNGVGRAIMAALHSFASAQGLYEAHLNSQLSAIPFYETLGYRAHGPVFDDAGIPHRAMTLVLPATSQEA